MKLRQLRLNRSTQTSPVVFFSDRYTAYCCNLLQELSSSWDGRSLGHNRPGPKSEGCCAPFRGGAGSPSNIMSPGPRCTSVPSGILMHPAVLPQ